MVKKSADGVAHFSGLQSCGSVWACPVCAAKIRQARAAELEGAIVEWLRRGGGVEFVTLTVPHRRRFDGDGLAVDLPLAETFDRVADGWRKGMLSGAWSRDVRAAWGIEAWVRTVEVTYGANGWHPHIHALLFTARPWTGRQRALRGEVFFRRWARWVERDGGGRCSRDAFRLVGGGLGAGAYLAKLQEGSRWSLGTEFTRADLKTGRAGSVTPFEFIGPAADGEAWALQRWWEWEAVTSGRRCMTWSVGGRAALGLDADEATDEELAAAEVHGDELCTIAGALWARLRRWPGTDAALLDAAERDGAPGVGRLIADVLRGPPI